VGTRNFVGRAFAVAALALAGLSACNNNPKQENWDLYNGTVDPFYRAEHPERPAPKPAPAPTRTETAPAPAPMATGNVLYIPTGERSSSGLMLEKRTPAEVTSGAEFEFQLVATNLTNVPLENVIVTDSFGPNFKMVGSEPAGDMQGSTARWGLGTLPPKGTQTIRVRATATGSQVSNCASASYSLAVCTTINVVQPALRLTKQAPAEVLICDNIPMRLTVTNAGTGVARNVHVRDTLPAGLTTTDGKTSVDLDAGTLAAGQSKDFTITTKASKTGTYNNKASAAADGNLTAESNQTTTAVYQPALSITCKAPNQVFIGREATFQFTVKSTGDIACNPTVTMPIPAGSTFVSATEGGRASGSAVTWNLGSMSPNDSKTVEVTLRPTGTSVGVSATATCTCATPASTNCSTNVVGIPAMLLDGTDNPDPIEVGKTTVYTLTVTNQGSANLTNVQLVCTMDEGDTMEYVSATGGTATVNGKTISFPAIATLAPGARQTYTITIRAKAAGQVQFRGDAKSNEITRPLVKIETTNFYK
jgi:uncharacterized repeat protein (TIGR01451 family)